MSGQINEEDQTLMTKYGISQTTKTMYQYKNHQYENLSDAIKYAKIENNRDVPELEERDR